jgi:ABC-type glutathione transport system ATPase component
VRDLRIAFGDRRVVDLERLDPGTGDIVRLAGESGSGKSITPSRSPDRHDFQQSHRWTDRRLSRRRGDPVRAGVAAHAMTRSPTHRIHIEIGSKATTVR